jgi:hypothetical protein
MLFPSDGKPARPEPRISINPPNWRTGALIILSQIVLFTTFVEVAMMRIAETLATVVFVISIVLPETMLFSHDSFEDIVPDRSSREITADPDGASPLMTLPMTTQPTGSRKEIPCHSLSSCDPVPDVWTIRVLPTTAWFLPVNAIGI